MKYFCLCLMLLMGIWRDAYAEKQMTALKTDKAPVVDGMASENEWDEAPELVTGDKTAQIDIRLKAVYTAEKIYFLVNFPDPDESREHKTWIWDAKAGMYQVGPEREDVFVFKWDMGETPADLSLRSDQPYQADIWFWKACRTDPGGYADDKMQILRSSGQPKHKALKSVSGQTMYLHRKGDEGLSAYDDIFLLEYQKDRLPRFTFRTPEGSRADIRAKGLWSEGQWTIEFERKLQTGHEDDIQFNDLSKTFRFGVSRYEIAGLEPDFRMSQPLFNSGDISEILLLVFRP